MKKTIIAAVIAGTMLLSGCVSEESYNKLLSEKVNIDGLNSALEVQNNSLKIKNESLEAENQDLRSEINSLRVENDKLRDNNSNSLENSSPNPPQISEVYDDEFIKVSYAGIEKSAEWSNRESITFLVENKTNVVLTFFPVCVALDGIDVGKLMNYDSISPSSRGKVYFPKDYNSENPEFDNKSPSLVSGSLLVVDMNNTGVLGERKQYEFSFSNIEI